MEGNAQGVVYIVWQFKIKKYLFLEQKPFYAQKGFFKITTDCYYLKCLPRKTLSFCSLVLLGDSFLHVIIKGTFYLYVLQLDLGVQPASSPRSIHVEKSSIRVLVLDKHQAVSVYFRQTQTKIQKRRKKKPIRSVTVFINLAFCPHLVKY